MENPFRPGAGHEPPYLAGREDEIEEFRELMKQKTILKNMILTGLRGVGKTVLLNRFKSVAVPESWWWVGTDLSESASISEETLALRLLTDLSVVTSNVVFKIDKLEKMGFGAVPKIVEEKLTFQNMIKIYQAFPGLVSDKLKGILELTWACIKNSGPKGIIFAYDEAQTIFDQPTKQQYPIALLLDVFQSIQKKNIPFMLVLTGLPTLFPKLVDSRTFAERMFRVVFLKKLTKEESHDAVIKPIAAAQSSVQFTEDSINLIIQESGGYPYFIQFICKEVYDIFIQQHSMSQVCTVPIAEIIQKLDIDFFAGRWAKATDRQRELLAVVAKLGNCQEEFTVQEVTEESKKYQIGTFSSSHINQMLSSLVNSGLVYKNRHGKYSFAVPLLDRFIKRQDLITLKLDQVNNHLL